MEEKKHRRIREQKHSSIWILVIVIIIAILTITSIFIDNKKFQKKFYQLLLASLVNRLCISFYEIPV